MKYGHNNDTNIDAQLPFQRRPQHHDDNNNNNNKKRRRPLSTSFH